MVPRASPFILLHSMMAPRMTPGPRCLSARMTRRAIVCTKASKEDEDPLLYGIPTGKYREDDIPTTFAYPHCFEPHPIAKYAADEVRVRGVLQIAADPISPAMVRSGLPFSSFDHGFQQPITNHSIEEAPSVAKCLECLCAS